MGIYYSKKHGVEAKFAYNFQVFDRSTQQGFLFILGNIST